MNKEAILQNILSLYCCKPSDEIIQTLYTEKSIFEDPISCAKGLSEISSQWYSMPKIFKESVTDSVTFLENESTDRYLCYKLVQTYTFKLLSKKKTMTSQVTLLLDNNNKIIRHQDLWDEKPLSESFKYFRLLNAKLIKLLF
jgi:hypothetical protein